MVDVLSTKFKRSEEFTVKMCPPPHPLLELQLVPRPGLFSPYLGMPVCVCVCVCVYMVTHVPVFTYHNKVWETVHISACEGSLPLFTTWMDSDFVDGHPGGFPHFYVKNAEKWSTFIILHCESLLGRYQK